MRFVFTTNDKFWSRVARFLSAEKTTHIAIIFENYGFNIVFDCSTSGFKKQSQARFFEYNRLVSQITINASENDEAMMLSEILENAVGAEYDFSAYKWMLYRGILRKFFGVDKPDFNPWQDEEKYLCTEVVEPITQHLLRYGINLINRDLASMTPQEIFFDMALQYENRPITRIVV